MSSPETEPATVDAASALGTEVLIRATDARKAFATPDGEVVAVESASFSVRSGEIFGIIGSSGAGKSTLVRLINGLEPLTSGSVTVGAVELKGLGEAQLRTLRLGIGMIFQQFNLFSSRTVAGNVEYPLKVAGWPASKRAARVKELLAFVGLSDKAKARTEQLSGGQKQRVGIARALATNPRILLADEATSALDPDTTHEVLRLLQRVRSELGITVIVITHEMDVVRQICDTVAVMSNGRIVEQGEVFEVFSNPQSDIARRFVDQAFGATPSGETVERLRASHTGTLVHVRQRTGNDIGRVLGDAGRLGVAFEIVYGGIEEIGARSFGSLTIELRGEPAAIAEVVARFREVSEVEELLA